jgi:SAM-dependent methyltransferase
MSERWFLDELAHAGPEHLDERFLEGYDRKQGHPDPSPDIEEFRSQGLDEHSTIVDLAAGTGQFARRAADVFGRVVAVDVSPAMVQWLRRTLTHGDVVHAGFLSYRHDGPPVDGVYTRNALHQLPDFWKGVALARIASMLQPGGVLRLHDLVFDFEPADAAERVEAWMAGAVTDSATGYTAGELAAHTRGEFSTYTWLLEPMLERTGFEILERGTRRGAYAAYTCRRR